MNLFKSRRHTVSPVSPSQETVTMIDRKLQNVIVRLNKTPIDGLQRAELISQLNELKHRREQAVQPKTYGRMLEALG